ncbi:CRISPR-associated helicase/endonuclease Cas3 [Aminirod propionatiphilus]|uniref:CRISPR-associated helicase/endonuclease Cas3 n=1 Tax=Aminirod propionatiphilus TaxID=3415223 RepID=A0ACD1DWF4_9BACT|nr:CRISPR-associated helicase/endonuclease Cas3 [Synergistota bacterium]
MDLTEEMALLYWGKTGEGSWHPLIYHGLDTVAVGQRWLGKSPALRRALGADRLVSWVLFFLFLHDLGKADVRFQAKAPDLLRKIHPAEELSNLKKIQSRDYRHGPAGLQWFDRDRGMIYSDTPHLWMRAVAAHHGSLQIGSHRNLSRPYAPLLWQERDRKTRQALITLARGLFLPDTDEDWPDEEPPDGLYGFCSVCDWIASNETWFPHCPATLSPQDYLPSRLEAADRALTECGLVRSRSGLHGMSGLFPSRSPRGIQKIASSDPGIAAPLLAVMEAPTGSGKTEAALSLASQWLAEDRADSVLFALPTQATANAMFDRLQKVAPLLFPESANVVLAHGKSRFNRGFQSLVEGGSSAPAEDGAAQCSKWLTAGKKRALLGQIGVCTLDQILLSALPVRHGFVRSFAISRSVLIVDEVHAYDSYMNGLMDDVLEQHRKAGGCAILLSATLQARRLQELLRNWNGKEVSPGDPAPYPLLSLSTTEESRFLVPDDPTPERTVHIAILRSPEALPDESAYDGIIAEAAQGQAVAVICNLVDHAQAVAEKLRERAKVPVDLFHARYTFEDRSRIEESVVKNYGPDRTAGQGRVLVATQVAEQSLDLDFDFMVSQLCPVDILFQRLGRLHRHSALHVDGLPRALVLAPPEDDFGLHCLIYDNAALLWRTRRLLEGTASILFPRAYREWIEIVYGESPCDGEPPSVSAAHEDWQNRQQGRNFAAHILSGSALDLADTDENTAGLTRDGETSLTLLPYDGRSQNLLDDAETALDAIRPDPSSHEVVHLQSIAVPASWKKYLAKLENIDGFHLLPVTTEGEGWSASAPLALRYSPERGLERVRRQE